MFEVCNRDFGTSEVGPGMINQEVAHGACGHGIEVTAALPLPFPALDDAEVGFVHERGGLQGVVGAFMRHHSSGKATEVREDQGEEFFFDRAVTGTPAVKELRDFTWIRKWTGIGNVGLHGFSELSVKRRFSGVLLCPGACR